MNNVQRIDFDKKRFVANGKEYFIQPELLSYDRLVVFNSFIPELAFNASIADIKAFADDIVKTLSDGNDMAKNYTSAFDKALNFSRAIKVTDWNSFFDAHMDQHLRFCALFCNTINEDATKYSKSVIDKKIEDFTTDIAIKDFFFLAITQLPNFKDRLNEFYTENKSLIESKSKKIKTTPYS